MKHTKIVCTIGPASQSKTRLMQMMRAGMDVARLNFSHSEYRDHATLIAHVRQAATALGKDIAIMQDLQGPRIRVGRLPLKGISVKNREKVVLLPESRCAQFSASVYTPIPVRYTELYKYVRKDRHIFIQDGSIDIKIDTVKNGNIYGHVVQGGTIFAHRGMNAPGSQIKTSVITTKDREDLKFGIAHHVDYVALSFVQSASDIVHLRRLLPVSGRIKIIAKIERQEAVNNFNSILKQADGVMIARGDLGVELNPAKVPLLQKKMILKCLQAAKPVIVATQMLESMIVNPRPTRAEAADVANAVVDHADAVMLSAESATGKFPIKAVQTMTKIIREIEQSRFDDLVATFVPGAVNKIFTQPKQQTIFHQSHSVALAAVEVGESISAQVIAILSNTGNTAALISQQRPQKMKIIVFTNNVRLLRQLALVWGVRGYAINLPANHQEFIVQAKQILRQKKVVKKGEALVVITGFGRRKGLHAVEAVVV